MSALLESLITDDARLKDLAANDAAEAEAIRADLEYLANAPKRELQRVSAAHALDLQEIRRAGL